MKLLRLRRNWLDLTAIFLFVVSILAYGLLYVPAVVMGIMSFNASTMPIFPIRGFTFFWFQRLFQDEVIMIGLRNSLIVGLPTALIATIIGTMAAFAVVRHRVPGRDALITFTLLPFITPRLILAVGLLCFFSLLGAKGSLFLVFLGHVMLTIPIALLFTMVRLIRFPNHIEDAAANLGASPTRVFRYITLPLLMPSIVASFFFSFCTSFDEVLIAFFMTGVDNTLPISIWAKLEHRLSGETVAVSTLLSLLTAAVTVFLWRMLAKPRRQPPQEKV
jgi:spermidine/putrescine transport system permease protein